MSGAVEDTDEALIDEDTLFQIMETLDVDGDGDVSKEEFMVPWMKLFPKLHRADFDKVWKEIDKDCSGTLSLPELASYYGFNLSPSAKRSGDQTANMTDEQIMEALQLSAALQELAEEKEQRRKDKEKEELDAVAAQLAAAQGGRRGGARRASAGGSDGLRRGSVGAVQGIDREKKKTLSGVSSVKMPTKVTQESEDPNVNFMHMCELGDERAIAEALKNKAQMVRMEDDKGEMPLHKLSRQGCIEATRGIIDILTKTDSVKIDLNWQDKQGKTPLFYAIEYSHEKLVQLFLDRGSDCMIENNNGWTVLHTAVNTDKVEMAELVLNHPKVSSQKQKLLDYDDKSRRTSLHIAAFKSKEGEMVALLLKHGADATAVDAGGNTGAKLAEKTGRRKSKELLDEHMAAAAAKA
jgi:hypothetical protein